MPVAIPAAIAAQIVALRAARFPEKDIAERLGVSLQTVVRYLARARHRPETRDPLYDPLRDGEAKPPSLTAAICGDPRPGRRELVAKATTGASPHGPDHLRQRADQRHLRAARPPGRPPRVRSPH